MPPAAVAAAAKTLGAVATGRGGEPTEADDAGAEAVPPAESKAAEAAAAACKSELLGGFCCTRDSHKSLLGAPTQGFFDYGPGYLLGCAARPFAPCMRLLGKQLGGADVPRLSTRVRGD